MPHINAHRRHWFAGQVINQLDINIKLHSALLLRQAAANQLAIDIEGSRLELRCQDVGRVDGEQIRHLATQRVVGGGLMREVVLGKFTSQDVLGVEVAGKAIFNCHRMAAGEGADGVAAALKLRSARLDAASAALHEVGEPTNFLCDIVAGMGKAGGE